MSATATRLERRTQAATGVTAGYIRLTREESIVTGLSVPAQRDGITSYAQRGELPNLVEYVEEHFEVRAYRAIQRHLVLSAVSDDGAEVGFRDGVTTVDGAGKEQNLLLDVGRQEGEVHDLRQPRVPDHDGADKPVTPRFIPTLRPLCW